MYDAHAVWKMLRTVHEGRPLKYRTAVDVDKSSSSSNRYAMISDSSTSLSADPSEGTLLPLDPGEPPRPPPTIIFARPPFLRDNSFYFETVVFLVSCPCLIFENPNITGDIGREYAL